MLRFLFIGPDHSTAVGGREQLARLHRQVLGDLLGDALDTILLPRKPLSGWGAVRAALSGRTNGADRAAEHGILAHIAQHDIGRIWLDGSNLGVLVPAIKRGFPRVEIFTFFHNVEPRFFLGAFRQRPGLRSLGVFAAAFVAERKAARWSDRLVVLNARDGEGVKRWHGREATDVLPMAIADGWHGEALPATTTTRALLFVGGSFYANQAGIAWFAQQVAPSLGVDTLVLGSGMEGQRGALERHRGVKVIGRVDDLAPYYRDALAVVAPIFDGSGMKTKVAEAWMHGKTIIGTSEAFTGYQAVAGVVPCNDSAAFITAIENLAAAPPPRFDPAFRALYEQHYSRGALRRAIERMIATPPAARYGAASSANQSPQSP